MSLSLSVFVYLDLCAFVCMHGLSLSLNIYIDIKNMYFNWKINSLAIKYEQLCVNQVEGLSYMIDNMEFKDQAWVSLSIV